MATRLVIKTTVHYSGKKVGGGQEFAAVGPNAPKTLREIFEKLRKQFYHPEDPQAITVFQAGVVLGTISRSGDLSTAAGIEDLDSPPQYDLKRLYPGKYPPNRLVRFYRRQEAEEWTQFAEEVHTDDTAQERLKTFKALSNESYQYHCRVVA